MTPPQEPSSVYGRVIEHLNQWLTQTPPARKILDVLVVFVAVLLGGLLYVGYQRTDTLLEFAGRSLSNYPEINLRAADRGWDEMCETAKKSGALCIELYTVDLARNTFTLAKIESEDPEALKRYGPIGRTRSFLIPGLGEEQMAAASAIITGDSVIVPRWMNPDDVGLYIPIPDHPGQLLCGVLVLTFGKGMPREEIVAARGGLLWFTESLVQ